MLAIWLAVTVLAYGGIVAAMYPILQDNAKAFEDYMKIFPQEFLAAFGMTRSLADPGVFFRTYIGSMLWPVIAAIAAIILATRPVAADVERGWAEVALGTPLTRGRYLAAAFVSQALVLALLAVATVAGVLVSGGLSARLRRRRFLLRRSSCGSLAAPSPASRRFSARSP